MDTTTTVWDGHLQVARDRIAADLAPNTDSPRRLHAALHTPDTVWAKSTTVPVNVRRFARLFHPVMALLWLTVAVPTFMFADRIDNAGHAIAVAMTGILAPLALGAFLAEKTWEYRDRARVWLSTTLSKYWWATRTQTLNAVRSAAQEHPVAGKLAEHLGSMTDGFEELLREYDHLTSTREQYRYATTYVLDEDELTARHRAVRDKLEEIVAVHMAAATFTTTLLSATPTRDDQSDDAGRPAPLPAPTHLTGQAQADLDAALTAVHRLLGR